MTGNISVIKAHAASREAQVQTPLGNRRHISDVLLNEDLQVKTSLTPNEVENGIVLHVSCQVQQVPHIPIIAQSIARRLAIEFTTIGGPEFCCGAYHRHAGDSDFESQIASSSLREIGRAGAKEFVSFCPSCDDSFGRYNKRSDLRQLNLTQFLFERLNKLRPILRPIPCEILLHQHQDDENRRRDAANVRALMEAIPGVRIHTSALADGDGPSCQSFRPMPADRTSGMFSEARRQQVDFVVVPYHSCYRQHCKMQLEHGIEVHHYLGLLAKSMHIDFCEMFKELRLLNNVDDAVARVQHRALQLGLSTSEVQAFIRKVVYC